MRKNPFEFKCLLLVFALLLAAPGIYGQDAPRLLSVARSGPDQIVLHWQPEPEQSRCGVFASSDGMHWQPWEESLLIRKKGRIQLSQANPGDRLYFRLLSKDSAGGESPPSRVYGVRFNAKQETEWLIVDGFDTWNERHGEGLNHTFGVTYGEALDAAGVDFDTCSHQAVGKKVRLKDYQNVVWFLGDDGPEEGTLDAGQRRQIKRFLEAGGHLFITGANLGQDLVEKGKDRDEAFLTTVLKTAFVEYDGCHYKVKAADESKVFPQGTAFRFNGRNAEIYPVDEPDVLNPALGGGGRPALSFDGVVGHYGVEFEGCIGRGRKPAKVMVWGFPFEAVYPAETRLALMKQVVDFFSAPNKSFGSVSITVRSSEGPIADVRVELRGTPFAAVTDKRGRCRIDNVPPGTYQVRTRHFMYEPAAQRVRIAADKRAKSELPVEKKDEVRETRSVWVVRNQMTSPEKIREMIRRSKAAGFNELIVQVRGRGDAYYRSETEPRSEALEEQPSDFDPLRLCIDEAHAAGLKVQAWMNAGYVWSDTGRPSPKSPKHILNRHPEWMLVTRNGRSLNDYAPEEFRERSNEGRFLALHNPEVQDYLYKVYMEVVQNYDIDGIHFDFIRWTTRGYDIFHDYDLGYGEPGRKAFAAQHGVDPYNIRPQDETLAYAWEDFRRDAVAGLVRRVYEGVQKVKPDVQVTAAVFARYHKGRVIAMQDWVDWLERGHLDAACIMAYYENNSIMRETVRTGTDYRFGGRINAGLGAYRTDTQGLIEQVRQSRLIGCEGQVVFAYGSLSDEDVEALAATVYRVPAKPY